MSPKRETSLPMPLKFLAAWIGVWLGRHQQQTNRSQDLAQYASETNESLPSGVHGLVDPGTYPKEAYESWKRAGEASQTMADAMSAIYMVLMPSGGLGPGAGARVPATVEELVFMMNQRAGVTAELASGDGLRYLRAVGAEGSHLLLEGGQSQILLRPDASRWGAFHEWMDRSLQLRTGGPMPGEDAFIEGFLQRHQGFLQISRPGVTP